MGNSFVYDVAKDLADEASKIGLHEHNAEIASAAPKQNENSGNLMVNLRWKISEGADEGKTVFDRLGFWADDYGINVRRLEAFCKAIGLDPSNEFGGKEIDLEFLTDWCEKLIGENATIKVGMDKGSTSADGTLYPPKPEVKSYKPYGSAKSVDSLLDLP